MKKLLSLIAALALCHSAQAWDGALHTAVASVAHDNLTDVARTELAKALGGYSIIYDAQWLDDVAKGKEYAHVRNYHNVPLTAKGKIIAAKKAAKSQVEAIASAKAFDALCKAVTALESREKLSAKEVANNIRYIVYIVGDLHCASHYVFEDRIEHRSYKYYYNKEKKPRNYMKYWESEAITSTFSWKSNEFVHQLSRLSADEKARVTAGSLTKWVESNAALYRPMYDLMYNEHRFGKDEYRLWHNNIYPLATDHIGVAGYRLAALLNGLFDASQPKVKIK